MADLSRERGKKWILLKIIKKSTDLAREMAEKIAKLYATFFPSPPVIFLFVKIIEKSTGLARKMTKK